MKTVLLSFDLEEFDMPLEYGKTIDFSDQIKISAEGTSTILDILLHNNIKATFFSTVVFATHAGNLIKRIIDEGHELASHGYFHSTFEEKHLRESKTELERLSGRAIDGFRMARMMAVSDQAIQHAGYRYNSSLNPVYLPGRYNNFFKPRTRFMTDKLIQLPASATPIIRFPLFWLSFHNLPLWLYRAACVRTITSDGYLNTYFHPWEFTDLKDPAYGLPTFVAKNSGEEMAKRFVDLLGWMKGKDYSFSTIRDFLLPGDIVPGTQ
ncbi:MAG TPA: polysaccharide deacetylase family protein [Chryseolinea sp.]|nr:polysaccharide deacetylase family protein [Chryseolinea sp.]